MMSDDSDDGSASPAGRRTRADTVSAMFKRPVDTWKFEKRVKPIITLKALDITPSPAAIPRPLDTSYNAQESQPSAANRSHSESRAEKQPESLENNDLPSSVQSNSSRSKTSDSRFSRRSPRLSTSRPLENASEESSSSLRSNRSDSRVIIKSTSRNSPTRSRSPPSRSASDSTRKVAVEDQSSVVSSKNINASRSSARNSSAKSSPRPSLSSQRQSENVDDEDPSSSRNSKRNETSDLPSPKRFTRPSVSDLQSPEKATGASKKKSSSPNTKGKSSVSLQQMKLPLKDMTSARNVPNVSEPKTTEKRISTKRTVDSEILMKRREFLHRKRALRENRRVESPAVTSQEETGNEQRTDRQESEVTVTMDDVSLLRVSEFKRRKQIGQITDLDVVHSLLFNMAKGWEVNEDEFPHFKSFVKGIDRELERSVSSSLELKRKKTDLTRSRSTADQLGKVWKSLCEQKIKLKPDYERAVKLTEKKRNMSEVKEWADNVGALMDKYESLHDDEDIAQSGIVLVQREVPSAVKSAMERIEVVK